MTYPAAKCASKQMATHSVWQQIKVSRFVESTRSLANVLLACFVLSLLILMGRQCTIRLLHLAGTSVLSLGPVSSGQLASHFITNWLYPIRRPAGLCRLIKARLHQLSIINCLLCIRLAVIRLHPSKATREMMRAERWRLRSFIMPYRVRSRWLPPWTC